MTIKREIVVMAATPSGAIAKYERFETRPEADAHVIEFASTFPDAFAATHPGEGKYAAFWVVDMVAKTLTHDDAAAAAAAADIAKEGTNVPLLEQIAALELKALRPMRELRRGQEHGDVGAGDIAFAKQKIRDIDNQIISLRAGMVS